jgi:hypothetical protein
VGGAGETHGDAVMEEEGVSSGIIKFTPVIALDILDGAVELSFNIGKEIRHSLCDIPPLSRDTYR